MTLSRSLHRTLAASARPSTAASRRYLSAAMTPSQIETIKATIPALQQHGTDITTTFYRNMLSANPELRNIFNITHQITGEQPKALASAVLAYASHIDNPAVLGSVVTRIAHKHVSLGVTPEQYAIVGENLLKAIKQTLGDAATEPIMDAWAAAYGQLADIFIDVEGKLYDSAASRAGSWKGWRKFKLAEKVRESDEITSFRLAPADGGSTPLPAYEPGQFVSVRCYVPALNAYQPRQYSLSGVPQGSQFQISVKREQGSPVQPAGRVSMILHEGMEVGSEVEVSMPFGDFVLDASQNTPVVLVSGGVGLTPLMAMLRDAAKAKRQAVFVHGARSAGVHAMKAEVDEIAAASEGNVSKVVFYENGAEGCDFKGRVDLTKIQDKVVLPDADYFVCGPLQFMEAQKSTLMGMGVDEGKIHMEQFGSPS